MFGRGNEKDVVKEKKELRRGDTAKGYRWFDSHYVLSAEGLESRFVRRCINRQKRQVSKGCQGFCSLQIKSRWAKRKLDQTCIFLNKPSRLVLLLRINSLKLDIRIIILALALKPALFYDDFATPLVFFCLVRAYLSEVRILFRRR